MSQRDIVVLFSKELNHSYVTTNIKYMNLSKQDIIRNFHNKKNNKGDGGNLNFEDRNGLISVRDIVLAYDFNMDVRKNAGIDHTPELRKKKKSVQIEYLKKGYKSANGKR